MLAPRSIDRRTFIADLGRGAFALAIVTVAGCSPSTLASLAPTRTPGASAGTGPSPSGGGAASDAPSAPARTAGPPPGSPPPGGTTWERVNLGFVSAYLLVRDGEAALVDCGVAESADEIEASLTGLNLDWGAVGHVILTHHHADHQGSIRTVRTRAPDATIYAGAEDVGSILVQPVTAAADGDTVFDLRIVTSPGHTAGSISVLDPIAGVLVVGDAMRTDGGLPGLPGAQFTVDMDQAKQSVVKLGALSFETLLVGHGNPIEGGAAALVAQLGATS